MSILASLRLKINQFYRFDEMHTNMNDTENGKKDKGKEDTNDQDFDQEPVDHSRLTAVVVPRGIVGLVGPYKVYQNPNERREYMLREEELVEEIIDSVSDIVISRENCSSEPHRRAKWKITEDDEETLVPDIRHLSTFQEYDINEAVEEFSKELDISDSEWKMIDEHCIEDEIENSNDFVDKVEGILFGKDKRVEVNGSDISFNDIALKKEKGKQKLRVRKPDWVQYDNLRLLL